MASSLIDRFNQNFIRFAEKRMPAVNSIELNQKRIFIVPTPQGLMLILVSLLVILMAINFDSALNYALGFWLISALWIAVYLTYRNLSGLTVSAGYGNLVCVGDYAELTLQLTSKKAFNRGVIEIIHDEWGAVHTLVHTQQATVTIPLKAYSRGKVSLPRFRIESRYPFGLIMAWSYIQINVDAWAYPEGQQVERSRSAMNEGDEDSSVDDHFYQAGSEDFHSLKPYQPGDSIRRFYWPGFSRDVYLVKSFTDYQSLDVSINWDDFPGVPDEIRLAAIAYYSQKYHKQDMPFGLNLPGQSLAPEKGIEHLTRVRRLLAEFGYEH